MILLKQYVAGKTARSLLALNNIKKLTATLQANTLKLKLLIF